MDKAIFLKEVESKLARMFAASKEGYKIPLSEKHRCEGFMQAGIFMGLVAKQELANVMESIHLSVFGQTIVERQEGNSDTWIDEVIDYSIYEQPAFERKFVEAAVES